jgi:hypothetical protein
VAVKKPWRLLIILVALVAAGVALYLQPRKIDLIVDNGLKARARIEVNGEVLGKARPYESFKIHDLQAGELSLVAVEIGPQGEEGKRYTLEGRAPAGFFSPRPTYVWNVNGETPRYWIVSKGYGERKNEPSVPFQPEGPLFQIPEGLLPELNGEFPLTVQVAKESGGEAATGAVRKMLWTERCWSRNRIAWQLRGFSPQGAPQGKGFGPGRKP